MCECDGVREQSSGRVHTLGLIWASLESSAQALSAVTTVPAPYQGFEENECCCVFMLFVVLNLIVINIFDLVCT